MDFIAVTAVVVAAVSPTRRILGRTGLPRADHSSRENGGFGVVNDAIANLKVVTDNGEHRAAERRETTMSKPKPGSPWCTALCASMKETSRWLVWSHQQP